MKLTSTSPKTGKKDLPKPAPIKKSAAQNAPTAPKEKAKRAKPAPNAEQPAAALARAAKRQPLAEKKAAEKQKAEKKKQIDARRLVRAAEAEQRAVTRAKARTDAQAERKRQSAARVSERKAARAAAYATATATMASGGEGALQAAALILKTKGSRQSDRKRAASVMGHIGGSIGGHIRAARLTPEQRTDIARRAGLARQLKAREERAKVAAKPAGDGRARRKPTA